VSVTTVDLGKEWSLTQEVRGKAGEDEEVARVKKEARLGSFLYFLFLRMSCTPG
jgi:hypothetical protein